MIREDLTSFSGFKHRQIIKRLKVLGFLFDGQAAGSHEILYNSESNSYSTNPKHYGDMPEGTLKAILKQAGIAAADCLGK